ncbi:MAG: APC family permease [Rhodospirillales bacterium]|nr:APC family permease [Rhodospirillales bacterium]
MTAIDTTDRLHRGTLGLGQIVASTMANIAPAMSFFFGFGVIAAGAGIASPVTILTAMIAILFLTNTLSEFTRYRPSTGSFVTFMGLAFGPATGAAVSVFVTFGYIIAASSVVAISGGWFAETLKYFTAVSVPWQAIALVAAAVAGVLVMRGISLSTRWAALFFYFEFALLAVGAVILLAANSTFLSLAPFRPSNLAGGLAGLGAGFPLAIYLFIGWENSAMLAEETAAPRHNVPRALVWSTLAIGLFYLLLAYATTVAFHDNATAIGKSAVPFVDAMKSSAPALVWVAYLAGLTSILSSLIALTNSQARILFSSGREGLLPAFFGKIHPHHRTPYVATWAFLVIALASVFIFGWGRGISAADYFGDAGTLGTIPVILVYMGTNLALPVFMLRHHREAFHPVRHLIVPVLGTLFMLLPLWGLVQPGQDWPFSIFPYVALVVLAIAAVYGATLARRMPELASRIGAYMADD